MCMNQPQPEQPQQPLKSGNSYCLALLATAKVDISTRALVSTTWRQTRKFIQVRNDTLIFFNKSPCDDLSNATQVIQLRGKHYGAEQLGCTVKIYNCPFSFTFANLILATQFNSVVQSTISEINQYNRSSSSFHRGLDRSSGYFQTVQHKNPYFPSLSTQLFDPRDTQRVLTVKRVSKADAFFSTTDLNNIISERIALQTVSSADSPFVQRLFHAYQDKQALCFVTDKPESSDLHSLLKYATDRRISESTARYLFAEAVMALSDVHDCGIAFGDFTPSKLGITESGHVKLCDFTHARHIGTETPMMTMPPFMPNSMESFNSSTTSSTESTGFIPSKKSFEVFDNTSANAIRSMDYGTVLPMSRAASKPLCGTRGFLSPEQLINTTQQTIDATAVDVWALGITLYMMITGRHPFLSHRVKISNRAELEQFMSTKTLKFPSFVSYELKRLLRGMLEQNPLERYTISDIRQSAWMQTVDWTNMRKSAEQEHIVDEIVALLMQSRMRRLTIPINTPNEDDSNSVWSLDEPIPSSIECTQRRVSYPNPFPWRKYRVRASTLDVLRRSPRFTCYNLLGFEFNHDSFR